MKIETQFTINNLIKHKFDTGEKAGHTLFEVLGISTDTCYAGTQIFYTCRPILLIKIWKDKWKEEGEFDWEVKHGVSGKDGHNALQKYREDEIVEAPNELVDIVTGK